MGMSDPPPPPNYNLCLSLPSYLMLGVVFGDAPPDGRGWLELGSQRVLRMTHNF